MSAPDGTYLQQTRCGYNNHFTYYCAAVARNSNTHNIMISLIERIEQPEDSARNTNEELAGSYHVLENSRYRCY